LDKLAQTATTTPRVRASFSGNSCHLSGVENQCRDLLKKGVPPAEIAVFCLSSIQAALEGMTERLLMEYGDLPVVYAGGVMSNTLIREALTKRFGARFAPPAFSSDNAAGIAVLTALKETEGA
jgi:N6-L-threonylcarbamoyladenine synthase